MSEKLPREFYEGNTLEIARRLLGCTVWHRTEEGLAAGKIVETEAYLGEHDAAAHSYKRLMSGRTNVQYGPGGHAYVYLIYGMYWCLNLVTAPPDTPHVVLLRALEPVQGIELMQQRRKTAKHTNLCSGPGKLCAALGITKEDYGADLLGDRLWVEWGEEIPAEKIAVTPRINIDYAGQAKDYPWRFLIKDNPHVSKRTP